MTNNSEKLYELGQSIWYDNIQRGLLKNGELAAMIAAGKIYGVTSNPSIFNKAISKSDDYDAELEALANAGKSAVEIFEALAVADIQAAADLFAPVYQATDGGDGYVSLEVNPDLAHDTQATCSEAKRLWKTVDRPNLMVKIPATQAGIPAIEQSVAEGLNINVTLIFSVERYVEVMEAYISGLERRVKAGKPIDRQASVASFFISRIDSKIDGWLDAIIGENRRFSLKKERSPFHKAEGPNADLAAQLRGEIAVANGKRAYARFKQVFAGERFQALQENGARYQRPLWASTSTKDPAYPDTKYVDDLIGPNTVNTVPPATLEAFNDHGTVGLTVEKDLEAAEKALDGLEQVGLSLDQATQELEDEGVAAFSKAFAALLDAVEQRRKEVVG
jgi:transaldolase